MLFIAPSESSRRLFIFSGEARGRWYPGVALKAGDHYGIFVRISRMIMPQVQDSKEISDDLMMIAWLSFDD